MERKKTGRLLAAFVVALVATLGLVLGTGTRAYAKEYTTLSVGDVLHVGDTINSTFEYSPTTVPRLSPNGNPWTLVRCNLDADQPYGRQVVESDSGAYYSFKNKNKDYLVYDAGSGVAGVYYNATDTSDGIYVTELGTASGNIVPVKFAVHDPVPVTSVELDQTTATLEVGKTATLKATVKPDDATDKSVVWASDNEKVATVSEDGVVTAVAEGKATITATSVDNDEASADCAVTVKAAPKPEPEPTPTGNKEMYRLYNPNSGEHFFTSNAAERDNVKAAGWTYEGVGWVAPADGAPVYRLYNENGGEHHYTTSKNEHDVLVGLGWKDEGIGWRTAGSDGVPVYRQYNPNAFANNHNFTVSTNERDTLVGLGWKDENIAWYGVR